MKRFLVLGICLSLASCQSPEPPSPTGDAEALLEATAAAHENDTPEPTPITEAEPATAVLAQELAYGSTDSANLIGYLAIPEDVIEPLPGIVVIHEWWGLNENIKAMTRRLAAEGYAALAVDLYGGSVAESPEQAESLMQAVLSDREATLANLRQAYGYLDSYALAPTIGTLGWCLGGGWSLQSGLELAGELDAVVMYYGQIITDRDELDRLDAPLLGLFAELDEAIPAADVRTFRRLLADLGKPAEVIVYPGVRHAFANPSGGAYDAGTAEEAWLKTLEFLATHLKPDTNTPGPE